MHSIGVVCDDMYLGSVSRSTHTLQHIFNVWLHGNLSWASLCCFIIVAASFTHIPPKSFHYYRVFFFTSNPSKFRRLWTKLPRCFVSINKTYYHKCIVLLRFFLFGTTFRWIFGIYFLHIMKFFETLNANAFSPRLFLLLIICANKWEKGEKSEK